MWRDDAACRGMDQAMFFPQPGRTLRRGLAVCRGCPVRSECLEAALDLPRGIGQQAGVRGATAAGRARIRSGESTRQQEMDRADAYAAGADRTPDPTDREAARRREPWLEVAS